MRKSNIFSRRLRNGLLMAAAALFPVIVYMSFEVADAGRFALHDPWVLLLLVSVPLVAWVSWILGNSRTAPLEYSQTGVLARIPRGVFSRMRDLPGALRLAALIAMVLALARPQTRDRGEHVEVEGIDIVIALDLSQSMEANDLTPNRLEAAKRVVDEFIARRKSDRIGLVVFGKEAYTQCPLTLDYSVLRNMLGNLQLQMIDGSATAIGNALGLSLARLRSSDAKSRVVILLTDGENNAGNVAPKQAARYARAMKVKVFTILMGPSDDKPKRSSGLLGGLLRAPSTPVNPKLLNEIATQTNGRAFLATDRRGLRETFEKILDALDKSTRRDVAAVFSDAYRPLAWGALLLLLVELGLAMTRLRRFP